MILLSGIYCANSNVTSSKNDIQKNHFHKSKHQMLAKQQPIRNTYLP